MERLIEFSGLTAITIFSMLLALLIEVVLLKFLFRCMAHVRPDMLSAAQASRPPASIDDLRKAGL